MNASSSHLRFFMAVKNPHSVLLAPRFSARAGCVQAHFEGRQGATVPRSVSKDRPAGNFDQYPVEGPWTRAQWAHG